LIALRRVWRDGVIAASMRLATQTPSSYPAKAGYPVRRSFSASSWTLVEYWITRFRFSRVTTAAKANLLAAARRQ
jgi:hypothetical protein